MNEAPPTTAPELLSLEQSSQILRVSQRTLGRLMKNPAFPKPVRLGDGPRGAVRLRRSDLVNWVQKGCPRSESAEQ